MSAVSSSSAQKISDHNANETIRRVTLPLLSTLMATVKLLLRATRNREFTTDSHFALDTLRQAVQITQPYTTHLQHELEGHGVQLSTPTSPAREDRVFGGTMTLLTRLGKLIGELARTRDRRLHGSVRWTLLGEVYWLLVGEMERVRKEVKRLEHLLEGKHRRKRHRGGGDGKGKGKGGDVGEGASGREMKSAGRGSVVNRDLDHGASSRSPGSRTSRSFGDGRTSLADVQRATRVYPGAIEPASRLSGRSPKTNGRSSSSLATRNNVRPDEYSSSHRESRPASIHHSQWEGELVPQNDEDRAFNTVSSYASSSGRSRCTRAPTVYTIRSSDDGISSSSSSKKSPKATKAEVVQSTIQVVGEVTQPDVEEQRGLHDSACQAPKHSSMMNSGSKASSHRLRAARPIVASSSTHLRRSESPSVRRGSVAATLGIGSDIIDPEHELPGECESVQSESARATLGGGNEDEGMDHEGHGGRHSPETVPKSEKVARSKGEESSAGTGTIDHVSFRNRLDGGWSFDAVKDRS